MMKRNVKYLYIFICFMFLASFSIKTFFFSSHAPEKVIVNISYPVYSLIPFKADDWSSFFVMNHIYGRLLEGKGEFRSNSLLSKINIACSDDSLTPLSPDCRRVRVKGSLKKKLSLCDGQNYSIEDFKRELSEITKNKSWIFPDFKMCMDSELCFEFDNVRNIQNNLNSIYLRFGWSKFPSSSLVYGVKPNCFYPSNSKDSTFDSGVLKLSDREIDLTTKPHLGDVFLYGSEPNSPRLKKISFYNPIYYFLIISGDASKNGLYFNNTDIESISLKFKERGFTDKNEKVENFAFKNSENETKQMNIVNSNHVIAIPDYLDDCSGLAKDLELPRLKFECVNIASYVEKLVKGSEQKWSGFISPLTPGMPGRDGMLTQYFSKNSSDSWLGKRSPEYSKVHQIGISNGYIQVSKDIFCSVRPNSLGLSDLTYDDFVRCN